MIDASLWFSFLFLDLLLEQCPEVCDLDRMPQKARRTFYLPGRQLFDDVTWICRDGYGSKPTSGTLLLGWLPAYCSLFTRCSLGI